MKKIYQEIYKFLSNFFENLNDNHITYCVLRNYFSLPYDTKGSDIDILVYKDHFQLFRKILEETTHKYNGKFIFKLNAERVLSLGIFFYTIKPFGIKFDIFSSYAGTNGCDILPAKIFFENSQLHNNIYVANNNNAAILSLVKEIIGTGDTRKNYLQEAITAYKENESYYKKILTEFWGLSTYEEIFEPLLTGKKQKFDILKKQLKWKCLKRGITNAPLKYIYSRIIDVILKIHRFVKPLGYSVAFIGTDGSGKSTIIEEIRPPLESALHSKIKYEHMRPNLLPSLASLLKGQKHEHGKQVTDPHGSKPSGFIGSFLRLFYYSLDYILGYWLKVYPDKVRKPCLYVFDRYFYDFMIDPARSRIALPKMIVTLIKQIIPEPDLVLCLGADPEVIHDRKPELPLGEVKRQINELKKFCTKNSRAVWIDTGISVDESVEQALSAIVDCMAARYE